MHADVKPDNILLSEHLKKDKMPTLKVCDLGSATDARDNEPTAYLVSRYYRAPEVVLGMRYDSKIDVWSAACTIYELATGKMLFPGRDNGDMLWRIMELRGRIPKRMITSGMFGRKHFDETDNNFVRVEKDPYTRHDVEKRVPPPNPPNQGDRMVKKLLAQHAAGHDELRSNRVEEKHWQTRNEQLGDLLEKCLVLDPRNRYDAKQALEHPYCKEVLLQAAGGGGGSSHAGAAGGGGGSSHHHHHHHSGHSAAAGRLGGAARFQGSVKPS
eukprot:GHVU01223672.1.p1 GENE.GHVU01223672.1~~GHVU01223672.1.p1  ORF type:complete len:270 (-),score=61.62 GHVU01223672.1:165-974(-)